MNLEDLLYAAYLNSLAWLAARASAAGDMEQRRHIWDVLFSTPLCPEEQAAVLHAWAYYYDEARHATKH